MNLDDRRSRRKAFGIGLNRTGTTTLGKCFELLGMKMVGFRPDLMIAYGRGETSCILSAIEEFDAFQDWPWPLVFRQLDQSFPDSYFVLTVRQSPDVWFESLCAHAEKTGPSPFRKIAYGYDMPHGRMNEHIAVYERHNEAVMDYFNNKPGQLRVVCWEQGDGWDELCGFLRTSVPPLRFPHLNRRIIE